jgi:hypothetical protein
MMRTICSHRSGWESLKGALQTCGVEAVFTNIAAMRDGKVVSNGVLEFPSSGEPDRLVAASIRGAMLPCSSTFSRELALTIGGYREELWQSEDYDFHIRLAATGMRWTAVDAPLVTIRVRPESRSANRKEVYVSGIEAITYLAEELPERFGAELAEAAGRFSGYLFQLGAVEEAKRGFSLAKSIGTVSYSHQNVVYRIIARALNPILAERFGAVYRKLPPGLRERVRSRGGGRPRTSSPDDSQFGRVGRRLSSIRIAANRSAEK